VPRCAACGAESPDGFRFCGACGAPLEAASPRREQRKTVTVLFCDVSGSTALGEHLDPEALRRTMGRYFEEIRAIVDARAEGEGDGQLVAEGDDTATDLDRRADGAQRIVLAHHGNAEDRHRASAMNFATVPPWRSGSLGLRNLP
jgi:class 3 adenylate cyclase